MAVLLHARDGEVEAAAGLHVGQQFLPQKVRIAAEVVVGIHADHGVEKGRFKGQAQGVRLDGDELFAGQSQLVKKRLVFRRFAPQVAGVYLEAVLLCQEGRGDALAAAQVAHHSACRGPVFQHQLFDELDGVGAHHLLGELGGIIALASDIVHVFHSFGKRSFTSSVIIVNARSLVNPLPVPNAKKDQSASETMPTGENERNGNEYV